MSPKTSVALVSTITVLVVVLAVANLITPLLGSRLWSVLLLIGAASAANGLRILVRVYRRRQQQLFGRDVELTWRSQRPSISVYLRKRFSFHR